MTAASLSCGCIRGESLCSKAVSLWNYATRKWEEATGPVGNEDYLAYDRARAEYEGHFEPSIQ